jgi:hypothetical protein
MENKNWMANPPRVDAVPNQIETSQCHIDPSLYSSPPLIRPLQPKTTPLIRPLQPKATLIIRPLPLTLIVRPHFTYTEIVQHYPFQRGHHSFKASISLQKGVAL